MFSLSFCPNPPLCPLPFSFFHSCLLFIPLLLQVLNCTQIVEALETYYLPTFYGIEFSVGFLGNLLVVLGYIVCLQQWQSCNIYLFSLAVSDLIFLSTLPRLCYLYSNHKEESNLYVCVINRYVLHVNLYSSILFMVWLSMDRFLLIKYPMRNHYLLRPRTALIVTGLSWIAVNVEVAPMITLMVQDLKENNWTKCRDFGSLKGDISVLGYSLGLTVTGYILPLFGLCVFSYQVAHLLRVQERALQRSAASSYKRPLKVVASAAALFLVLYTPYHVKCDNSNYARLGRTGDLHTDAHKEYLYLEPTYSLFSQRNQPHLLLPHG